MSIFHQLRCLILNQQPQSIIKQPDVSENLISDYLHLFWTRKTPSQQKLLLLQVLGFLSLSYYILAPSLSKKQQMFNKRPDKHTTGLINLRNDCFANSSVQAYSALPGLTDYLNKFIASYKKLHEFVESHGISWDELVEAKLKAKKAPQNSKFKNSSSKFDIALHMSLASIIKKLQETQMTTRTISVWTFLHCLEGIFNAKISRSQHDAHELTQLINETLEHENLKIKSFYTFITHNLQSFLGKNNFPTPQDYEILEALQIPEFPFNGLVLSQMKCLACNCVSKPSFTPFTMLTLHTPQTFSTDLDTLLNENESESIEGYQCLKCRISRIEANEKYLNRELDPKDAKFIESITKLNSDPTVCINDDLPKELEEYVKNYNVNGVDISKVTSTVFRKTQILKPPKIFGLHLSRSSFNGVDITRNSCRVSFKDKLTLSIGLEYHDELKNFQAAASQDEFFSESLTTNVLTTDVDDMEDEDVQREDIDEKGEEDEDDDEDDPESTTTEGGSTTEGDEDDLDQEEADDNASVVTELSDQPSITTTVTLKNSTVGLNSIQSSKGPETLNNAPITNDQTDDLKAHFKKFKFNENDNYRYRLKAVIRHQGSHTQGHYECYKRKPLYVKDKEGNIYKLSPEIKDDIVDETPLTESEQPKLRADSNDTVVDLDDNKLKKSSTSRSTNVNKITSRGSGGSDNDPGSGMPASIDENQHQLKLLNEEELQESGNFRRKFSSMMGRRTSVFQADPGHTNIQEIIDSGLATPAEIIVEGLEQPSDYFSLSLANGSFEKSLNGNASSNHKNTTNKDHKVKMKKIPSLIKNGFWRISDSRVAEVSRASVLCENETVYMLYYERVDRAQVKRRTR
jgi:ubiquitin carboxyl-terminal hydrolase 16